MPNDFSKSPHHINTNTYVSISVIVLLVGGFAVVMKGVGDTKNETISMKNELSMQALKSNADLTAKIDKLETRMTNLETGKNVWTSVQMLQWAIHLQQLNKDGAAIQKEGLKVPEPEIAK